MRLRLPFDRGKAEGARLLPLLRHPLPQLAQTFDILVVAHTLPFPKKTADSEESAVSVLWSGWLDDYRTACEAFCPETSILCV